MQKHSTSRKGSFPLSGMVHPYITAGCKLNTPHRAFSFSRPLVMISVYKPMILRMPFDQRLSTSAVVVHPLEKLDVLVAERIACIDPLKQTLGAGQTIVLHSKHQGRNGLSVDQVSP
jgi:hypothetical protein